MIKDSGDRTEFETGAKRDMHAGKGRMDLLPWYGIMEVSKHCEEGALKYGEHNVDKGIPLHSLLDSASRHLAKYIVGMDDEDHLRAACWNLLWGLGAKSQADPNWITQYAGQAADGQLQVTKDGGTINAITGATITSRAVTDGVNTAAAYVATLG